MAGSRRQILAEELVRSVDEMYAHRTSLSYVTQVTPRAGGDGHKRFTRTLDAPRTDL
jgi:hypothetical protein